MVQRIFALLICLIVWAGAASTADAKRILYIPHDDRPISLEQTAATAEAAGISLILPPTELLGGRDRAGDPDALWAWLDREVRRADAVVVSADSLIYGSLVASRKHDLDESTLKRRTDNFRTLKDKHNGLTTYVFASVMRSPRASEGGVEPAYYERYGPMIFEYTSLLDKQETRELTRYEKKQLKKLSEELPEQYLRDWLSRREKNLAVTLQLVKLAHTDSFKYLIVGRDDNAPYSQTRRDCRRIDDASQGLGKSRYASVPGVDELGLLMLTRAISDLAWDMPRVATIYAPGIGSATIPTYSDEPCGKSITAHLFAAGAYPTVSTERADIILAVNTDKYGRTYEAAWPVNDGTITDNHRALADSIERELDRGKKVALADIKYANGADNGLMNCLAQRGILPRLYAYGGWNTADNTTGFVIAQSILASAMTDEERTRLLAVRYLDDWGYQSNVRQYLQDDILANTKGKATATNVKPILPRMIATAERKLTAFADRHLPFMDINDINVSFPWNRTFEIGVEVTFTGDASHAVTSKSRK